jgi:hypothetical protein
MSDRRQAADVVADDGVVVRVIDLPDDRQAAERELTRRLRAVASWRTETLVQIAEQLCRQAASSRRPAFAPVLAAATLVVDPATRHPARHAA